MEGSEEKMWDLREIWLLFLAHRKTTLLVPHPLKYVFSSNSNLHRLKSICIEFHYKNNHFPENYERKNIRSCEFSETSLPFPRNKQILLKSIHFSGSYKATKSVGHTSVDMQKMIRNFVAPTISFLCSRRP